MQNVALLVVIWNVSNVLNLNRVKIILVMVILIFFASVIIVVDAIGIGHSTMEPE